MSRPPLAQQASSLSGLSAGQSSASIDPDQLLSTCHQIKESLDGLDRSIRLAQLRLTTLIHVGPTFNLRPGGHFMALGDDGASSLKCFDDMVELCRLSQTLVLQLEVLHQKLKQNTGNSIGFQIAAQQLMYFTSEWYDNLTPKFNDTFELAERVDACLLQLSEQQQQQHYDSKGSNKQRQSPRDDSGLDESDHHHLQTVNSTETRVRNSLVRLRQSMSENERLILNITKNLETTSETIEAIYGSLRLTKLNLDQGERNIYDSMNIVQSSQKCRIIFLLIILFGAAIFVYFIYKLID